MTFEDKLEYHLNTHSYWETAYEDIDKVPEEEYAKIRMDYFGASDSSKLLEVNPFSLDPLKELLNEKLTGKVDETIGKKASVRMGKDIEPIILKKAANLLKVDIYKPRNMYKDKTTILATNFDGVTEEFVPVEAKAVTRFGKKYYNFLNAEYNTNQGEAYEKPMLPKPKLKIEDFEDLQTYINKMAEYYGVPVYYYTQVQQQILALNSQEGFLAVLDVENWDMHIFRIYKDDVTIREIKSRGSIYGVKLEIMKSNKKTLED